jgi:hypothetical protein
MIKRLLTLSAIAFAALPGVAHACTQPETSQPFALLADTADYWLAPGGSFESNSAAWTLTKAAPVDDNEPYFVHGKGDEQALAIQPGGQAVSPAFCVDSRNPTLRLFARKSGLLGGLKLDLLYTNSDGRYSERTTGYLLQSGLTGWTPSPLIDLAAAMPPGQMAKGDMTVRLRFTAGLESGGWAIDDVYVDPFKFD